MHFLHFVFLLQDMWREWEKYKVALEASRSPEFMLICEKWQQLKFISREEMARSRHALPVPSLTRARHSWRHPN